MDDLREDERDLGTADTGLAALRLLTDEILATERTLEVCALGIEPLLIAIEGMELVFKLGTENIFAVDAVIVECVLLDVHITRVELLGMVLAGNEPEDTSLVVLLACNDEDTPKFTLERIDLFAEEAELIEWTLNPWTYGTELLSFTVDTNLSEDKGVVAV